MTTNTALIDSPVAKGISFVRLCKIELRKMLDTRAGRWLMVVMLGISALVTIAFLIWGPAGEVKWANLLGIVSIPFLMLMPVIGIMAATQEWTHRTGLVTFTLEPRRGRVVAAKVVAALVLGLSTTAGIFAFSALGTAIRGGDWNLALPDKPASNWLAALGFVLAMVIFVAQGTAFGLALLSTPLAIVATLVLPTVWSFVGAIPALAKISPWLNLQTVVDPLMSGTMTGDNWAKLATSVLVWVGIPLAIGTWRVLTREVK